VARHSAQSLAQLSGASHKTTAVESMSHDDAEEAMPLRRAA
jgi:hypothetical protein